MQAGQKDARQYRYHSNTKVSVCLVCLRTLQEMTMGVRKHTEAMHGPNDLKKVKGGCQLAVCERVTCRVATMLSRIAQAADIHVTWPTTPASHESHILLGLARTREGAFGRTHSGQGGHQRHDRGHTQVLPALPPTCATTSKWETRRAPTPAATAPWSWSPSVGGPILGIRCR